jgi:hypothetical protein
MSEALARHDTDTVVRRCKGTKKGGSRCTSPLVRDDGYCVQHSPIRRFDAAEAGRKGGQRSALARRSQAKNGANDGTPKDARERLRELLEIDAELQAKLQAVVDGALEAVTTCPNCKAKSLPDHRVRLDALRTLHAEALGKPKQNVEAKHEHSIVVVNRTREALEDPVADSTNGLSGQVLDYDELTAGA